MPVALVSEVVPPSWSGSAVLISRLLDGEDPDAYRLLAASGHPPPGGPLARLLALRPRPAPGARGWLPEAHTMIGVKRLDNLHECVEDVLERAVPGDLIEAGVWRGGASIFMRAVLKAHGVEIERSGWRIQGLPPPNDDEYPADAGDLHHTIDELAVSLDEVRQNFRRYDLLDDQVRFIPGWFRDTLRQAPLERLAVIRIDADMYESTTQCSRPSIPSSPRVAT